MPTLLRELLRSFSVQLLLLHLRSHLLLLVVWILLLALMSGRLGPNLGLQYLFLDPEYLGQTGFWSFLIVGLAFGLFTMSWNLSTYLLLGGYFNFLASLARPFFKFCVNNALLPLSVLGVYLVLLVKFFRAEANALGMVEAMSGLLLGVTLSIFVYAIYFNLTNRDINYYLPKFREPPPNLGPGRGMGTQPRQALRPSALGPRLAATLDNPYGVRTYLNVKLQPTLVRSVAHYDPRLLRGIFRQNHLNALLLQAAIVVILIGLGLLIDFPLFQIPAGASFLVLLSLFASTIGAVSYWFTEWRLTLLVLLLAGVEIISSKIDYQVGNWAYGLDYTTRAEYNPNRFEELYGSGTVNADRRATRAILDNWLAKQDGEKPPFVIICASGGGLAAATWALHVGQELQRRSGGEFLKKTVLMTGASGGQLGLAYLREAYRTDADFTSGNAARLDRIASDLLNPVAFSIVSNDLFLPFTEVEVMNKTYRRDRAYGFEEAWNRHTDYSLQKPLIFYREPERRADIPLQFITPSIIDDGRRLVISPQGVSYMTAPPAALRGELDLRPDMVDFRWLLREQDADSLNFVTALRMNATYPYVLPLVELPTRPAVQVMDAGYRDNYGVVSAARFVDNFREWILENTSGVVVVQVSAFREEMPRPAKTKPGVISNLFSPVGVAGNILGVQILDQEMILGQLASSLGPKKFQLYRFNYEPAEEDALRTSVSFHLTEAERRQVLHALDAPEMQRNLERVLDAL